MTAGERTLITAETFRTMARKGAKASDFDGMAVLKTGGFVAKDFDAKADPQRRMIPFILSNENLDREGDSISSKGWDLSDYKGNPVVLWAHDHGGLPVAKAEGTMVDGDGQLKANDEFASADLYPFADTVYRMLQGGFLSACSVGFQPAEWDMSETGVNFVKQSLLEHSVCPVPAHPQALVIARSKGIDVLPLKHWAEKMLDSFKRAKAMGTGDALVKKQLERLRAQTDPTGRKVFAAIADLDLRIEDVKAADETPAPVPVPAPEPVKATEDPVEIDGSVVEDAAAVPEAKAPITPAYPAGQEPDANSEEAERRAYGTMASVIQECGTGLSTVMDALGALMTTPTPAPGQQNDEANERAALDMIVTNVTNCVDALNGVLEMGQALLDANTAPETAPAAGAGNDVPAPAAVQPGMPAPRAAEAEGSKTMMKRWNPRLSKAFDIEREQIPAADKTEALVARFFDVDLKHIEKRQVSTPSFRMGSFLSAINDELQSNGWNTVDVRNINWRGEEIPPSYDTVQLNSTLSSDFLVDGVRFLKRIDETTQKEERFALELEPEWWGISATYYGVRSTGTAAKALSSIAIKQQSFNFLKGEAFALAGEFLPKTDETFDGLFLTPANKASMERVVALINSKGAELENRGMLLVGPPGTGKTLSARITRNVANCTFIWISSRDFYAMGAFGGITGAYDLARECASGPGAPTSVIVFEDIDNWLSDHTLDLLKTELDGVGRSSGVVTLMTTNYPEYLPKALLDRPGRFHDVLRFGLPDETVRRAMLKKWIDGIDEVTLIKAVDATKGYSGAHIRELARFAAIIGEQDALDLSTSVERALAKLAEQRDLITNGLTGGSRYRVDDDIAVKTLLSKGCSAGLGGLLRDIAAVTEERVVTPVVQKTLGDLPIVEAHDPSKARTLTEAAAAGGIVLETLETASTTVPEIVPAVRQAELIEDGASAVDGARELMECAKTLLADDKLTAVQRAKVKQAQAKIFSVLISTSKAGRVLSSANEARINQAKGLLQEVLDQLETAPVDTSNGVDPMNPPPLVGVLPDAPQTELAVTPAVVKGSDVVLVLDEEQVVFEGDAAEIKDDVTSILRAAIDEQVMLNTGRVH